MKIYYDSKIQLNIEEKDPNNLILKGPLGLIKIYLGPRYKNHGSNYIELNENFITKQKIRLLKHLNNGLIIGYRKRLYQSGVWTIMKKIGSKLLFKLGYSHLSVFKIPEHVIFRSRRPSGGQFRTIHLYSISYQLVADTAAQLLRLRKADVYRLNGFRYRLPRLYGPRATNIRLKIGKKK